MKFNFFTLGGRFRWEDIYNYHDWRIQRNIQTGKYRLLDPYNIRRDSGYFGQCKDTLLKYIEAYELDSLKSDTIIILHSYLRTRNSVKALADSLKDLNANVICINYASLYKSMNSCANTLSQLLNHMEAKGNLSFINIGSACLLTRKLLSNSNNYRHYNITRILDVNPMNSGSDFAELLIRNRLCKLLFGPMLLDITTRKALSVAKLPSEIPHGIIFCPSKTNIWFNELLKKFESFPFSSPPSEKSYATDIKEISQATFFPLDNPELHKNCLQYMENGTFVTESESVQTEK